MHKKVIALTFITTHMTSCATMRDSLLLGGTIGAATGGFMANQASNHDPRSTAIGAVSGALIGSLLGFVGRRDVEKKESDRKAQLDALQGKPQFPSVTTPQVRAIWVPDKIENNQFIQGHYIYVIDKPATFRKE